MKKRTIEDIDVKDKKVLLRVDFNVPLDDKQKVTDDTRIVKALPTINYLIDHGAKLMLVSHLGRPKGEPSDKFSLRPVVEALEKRLNKNVAFSPTVLGPVAQSAIECLKAGECILLENIRFHAEEEQNDPQFAKELASLADVYVNDAFGTAHRAHASTAGVAKYFDDAACGFLIQKELEFLGTVAENPDHPFCAIVGGAKVKDKIKVISRLLDKADDILIGGGMAYTFLQVKGHQIGNSILDDEHLDLVKDLYRQAADLNKNIHTPVDHIIADAFNDDAEIKSVGVDIPEGYMGMDIGPKTIENFMDIIGKSKTILWNGPMGVFEMSNFQNGTFKVAEGMADNPNTTIVGGGDSVAAVNQTKKADKMSHVSTGGGASLEFLEGKILPGIDALSEN